MSRDIFGFDLDRAWDYENGFYLTSDPTRIGKLLAHYELYRRILPLHGHVVECGVFKGASLLQFAIFRRLLENDDSRRIIGFDAFGPFPGKHDGPDAVFVEQFERRAGTGIAPDELQTALRHKKIDNVTLIPGDILETAPQWVAQNPELKIALLHVDVDVYEPTKASLENLFDRVVAGGIVILDDYGTVAGATRAIDEFLAGRNLTIEKLPLAHIPAFLVKP